MQGGDKLFLTLHISVAFSCSRRFFKAGKSAKCNNYSLVATDSTYVIVLFLEVSLTSGVWHQVTMRCGNAADLTICNLLIGINFRHFNIMPTRLKPFLQMLLAWVVNLSCSSTETPSSFSSGFCTTLVLSILTFNSLFFYSGPKIMVQMTFREVTFQKVFVIPLGHFVPFFVQNLFYLFNRFSSMWQFYWWSPAYMNNVQFFTR